MASLADTILFDSLTEVDAVLQQGADVNEIDDYGLTPLIETVLSGKLDMAELLLQQGADVNEPDLAGSSPLHWAVENNQAAFCRLFLEHKADANAYNSANQPVLVKALLRDQHGIKKMLYDHGADLNFAQDYINTKLLGHRFELSDQVDIVSAKGHFLEVPFAGFFLEFTLGVIYYSLKNFLNNYAARELRAYFHLLKPLLDALATANQLIHFQQYLLNYQRYSAQIKFFLKSDLLIIPLSYEGHAICFVKYKNILAKCDRGANAQREGAVVIYHVGNPQALTPELLENLIYQRQSYEVVHRRLNEFLMLSKMGELPLTAQVIGNCSWANIEAALPTVFFLVLLQESDVSAAAACELALNFYDAWQEWDKDVALNECIQSFWLASPARKASKAALLGAVLAQTCLTDSPVDQSRAKRILAVLVEPDYRYVLKSYLKIYQTKYHTPQGKNLLRWLREMDNIYIPDYLD